MRHLSIILLLLVGVVGIAHAQSGGGYNLEWNTIDGGGITFATGGNYTLGSAIGQPDAGSLSGGNYVLAGGFWQGLPTYRIYLPIVVRNSS